MIKKQVGEVTDTKRMMAEIQREYELRIGYDIDNNSRLQQYVQDRMALSNAWRPYTSYREIGEMFGKDHSSIVHYLKEHESMMFSYPSYISKYNDALELTHRISERMNILPSSRLGKERNMHQELELINKTIKTLRQRRKKLEEKLGIVEQSR